jgi:hypothetical protein
MQSDGGILVDINANGRLQGIEVIQALPESLVVGRKVRNPPARTHPRLSGFQDRSVYRRELPGLCG